VQSATTSLEPVRWLLVATTTRETCGSSLGKRICFTILRDRVSNFAIRRMDSPKVAEANKDNRIVATFEKGQKYLSISGHSETVKDQAKINEIWKDAWKAWFPGGNALRMFRYEAFLTIVLRQNRPQPVLVACSR
jgi:hypothetical protein